MWSRLPGARRSFRAGADQRAVPLIADDAGALRALEALARAPAFSGAREAGENGSPAQLAAWRASGLPGVTVPFAYGGAEIRQATLAAVLRRLARLSPALAHRQRRQAERVTALVLEGREDERSMRFGEALRGMCIGDGAAPGDPRRPTLPALDDSTLAPVLSRLMQVAIEAALLDARRVDALVDAAAHVVDGLPLRSPPARIALAAEAVRQAERHLHDVATGIAGATASHVARDAAARAGSPCAQRVAT